MCLAVGLGMSVTFQDGPIGEGFRNGAFVEDLLIAVRERLKWYQSGEFKCDENTEALRGVSRALNALDKRTAERRERGVEGTHTK